MESHLPRSVFQKMDATLRQTAGNEDGDWKFDEGEDYLEREDYLRRIATEGVTDELIRGQIDECLHLYGEDLEAGKNDWRQCERCLKHYRSIDNFRWGCRYHPRSDQTCCSNTMRRRFTDGRLSPQSQPAGCKRCDHTNSNTHHIDAAKQRLPLLLVHNGVFPVHPDSYKLSQAKGQIDTGSANAQDWYIEIERMEP